MAKWVLPEGRKPLPDEWFKERAQMQERINGLEERLKAATDDAKEAEAYAGELEDKLATAVEALEECVEEIDAYIQHQYPHDHPVQERHRQRDYASNPARLALAELTSSGAANGEAKGGKDE